MKRVTHCKHGHAYDLANTGVARNGKRYCRACRREYSRVAYFKKRPEGTGRMREILPADPLVAAWAAGYFEGEGSLGIRDRSGIAGNLTATLTSTDRDLLESVASVWGGSVIQCREPGPRNRRAWRWFLVSRECVRFLADIQPHIKGQRYRERIRIALEFQHQRSRSPRVNRTEIYRVRQLRYVYELRRATRVRYA